MKWFWLTIIILAILAFFAFKTNLDGTNLKIMENNIEYKIFDCPGFGATFKFPNFKNWELKYIENKSENLCIMYFNWPEDILYEYPPSIEVEKVKREGGQEDLLKNPQGVSYQYIQDPTLYVEGHKFEEGDWDWLVFYGPEFDVRIQRNMFGEPPFDADLFSSKIVESFNF